MTASAAYRSSQLDTSMASEGHQAAVQDGNTPSNAFNRYTWPRVSFLPARREVFA